jgi:Tol biopolymer transport system component
LVATERGDTGGRLVVLDEHGDRMCELVQPATTGARDMRPTISPDGRWVVFESSRGRTDSTSLWIARVEPEAVARPLTHGTWIDADPAWTPDGRAVVFASTRRSGNFDLYRIALDGDGHVIGEPVQLTQGEGHEVAPAIANDGTIYYTAVRPIADAKLESHIERLASDGTISHVTDGPADSSPAIAPDGKTLAFARAVAHASGADADLWLVATVGSCSRRRCCG